MQEGRAAPKTLRRRHRIFCYVPTKYIFSLPSPYLLRRDISHVTYHKKVETAGPCPRLLTLHLRSLRPVRVDVSPPLLDSRRGDTLTPRLYHDARTLRFDDHGSSPRIRYARPVRSATSRRTYLEYLYDGGGDARAQRRTLGLFDWSARRELARLRGVGTMRATGPEHSDRSPAAHGDRKSTGREIAHGAGKTVTV